MAEWDAIKKTDDWDFSTPYNKTIHYIAAGGNGTQSQPYAIKSADNWDTLSVAIGPAMDTAGKHFKLDVNDSLTVSTMLGTSANPFKGTFDGNGKTLNFNFTNSDNETPAAPFAYVSGATIKNLHTTGTISGNYNRASGLIGENENVTTITNCRVSVDISGEKLIAGFCIGTGGKGITFEGCVFDGKITAKDQCGAFVGWLGSYADLKLTNCVCAPQSGSSLNKGGTFYYLDTTGWSVGSKATLTNCYYLTSIGTEQGKKPYKILPDNGVMLNTGKGAKYDVSGIISFPAGLYYGKTLYAGEEDEVPVYPRCNVPAGKYARYYSNEIQLTRGVGDAWMLTMPGTNVTIRAETKTIEPYGTATFTLPKGTKTIGKNAFEGIKASVVYVPDEVQSIGAYAFGNHRKLKQIRLPKDCEIDEAAFYGCTNLMAIYTSGDGKAKNWAKNNGFGYMEVTSQSGN